VNDDRETIVAAMWQAWVAKPGDDYVIRGRALAALTDQDLQSRFVEAYKTLAADFGASRNWRDTSDAGAEFQLRNQEPPFALIVKEMEVIQAALLELIEENPALWEMIERELKCELEPIIRMLIDPKAKS
jgi:hypothetical protein